MSEVISDQLDPIPADDIWPPEGDWNVPQRDIPSIDRIREFAGFMVGALPPGEFAYGQLRHRGISGTYRGLLGMYILLDPRVQIRIEAETGISRCSIGPFAEPESVVVTTEVPTAANDDPIGKTTIHELPTRSRGSFRKRVSFSPSKLNIPPPPPGYEER